MTYRSSIIAAPLIVLALVGTGCAKRPVGAQAPAPPPTGGARSTTADIAKAPGPQSGGPGTTASPQPDRAGAPGTQGTDRPSQRDFVAVANLKDIHFDFDKYDIRPADTETLDENAKWLRVNAQHLVLIEGHADERGTNEYNLSLGERRAQAAMNYLVSRGIPASRFTVLSYGEERPACTQRTEACWARNRRARFLVKPR